MKFLWGLGSWLDFKWENREKLCAVHHGSHWLVSSFATGISTVAGFAPCA